MTDPLTSSWHRQSIEQLCTRVTSGATPLRANSEFYHGGDVPWFKTKELADRVLLDSEEHITALAVARTGAKVYPTNTVLMAMYGDGRTITTLGVLTRPSSCNQACCVLIANPKRCDHRFLFYALKHHRQDFIRLATGGAQRNLSTRTIRQFELEVPPFHEQRSIGQVLGALDDKIELNRQMNETLEAMARALFKSWFVDFDPVRAKADGRQPWGMDAETAALFPSEFENSELGEIPKGWRVGTVGECVTVVGGSTPSTAVPGYWEGGNTAWATPKDLSKLSDPVLLATERLITPAGLAQIGSGLLPPGTVLLSSRAPIGYVAVVELPVAVNQGFIAMVCDKGLTTHYVRHWTEWNMEAIKGRANGTTFMEVSKAAFRPMPVVCPPSQVLSAFEKSVGPLHASTVNNLRQSETLAGLRDTLLPKLLSGEVRVREAERMVEVAG